MATLTNGITHVRQDVIKRTVSGLKIVKERDPRMLLDLVTAARGHPRLPSAANAGWFKALGLIDSFEADGRVVFDTMVHEIILCATVGRGLNLELVSPTQSKLDQQPR